MKLFLDIGAHRGETLRVVMASEWAFDRIFSFEPAPACWPYIEAMREERIELCRFGLWKSDKLMTLYNPGSVGASIARDKEPETDSAVCEFRDAATWFKTHVRSDDRVFAKINVEGAEVDVIERLNESGELAKIDHLLIHADVRKVPTLRHREDELLGALEASGVAFQLSENIEFGGVYRGTRNWLRWCHSNPPWRDFRYKAVARLENRVRVWLYPGKQLLLSRR